MPRGRPRATSPPPRQDSHEPGAHPRDTASGPGARSPGRPGRRPTISPTNAEFSRKKLRSLRVRLTNPLYVGKTPGFSDTVSGRNRCNPAVSATCCGTVVVQGSRRWSVGNHRVVVPVADAVRTTTLPYPYCAAQLLSKRWRRGFWRRGCTVRAGQPIRGAMPVQSAAVPQICGTARSMGRRSSPVRRDLGLSGVGERVGATAVLQGVPTHAAWCVFWRARG